MTIPTPDELMAQMLDNMQATKSLMEKHTPTVKFNRNGYEIRTQVLELAKETVFSDYHYKLSQYELSVTPDNGFVELKVELPAVPGTKEVLDAAKIYYEFINDSK